MTVPAARRPRAGDDGGFTLIETTVGLVVMSILLVMFTGAMMLLFGSSNRSQAVAHTSQQLSSAFTWLDRKVRYADYVSEPGQDGNDGDNWYLEFRLGDATGACYQLRLDRAEAQLQQRSWTGTNPPGAWTPIATGVVNGASQPPFAVTYASGAISATELTVHLVTSEGSGPDAAQSETVVTFAALNTDPTTSTGGVCTGERP